VPEGTSLGQGRVERKDARTAVLHVPLEAAPQGQAQVKAVTVSVHVILHSEW